MRIRTLAFIAALLPAACAQATPDIPVAPAPPAVGIDEAVATITAADVQRRIAFLASDSLQGRDTPSPGLEKAAAYIANEFRSFGLQPAGDSGSFIQRFAYDRSSVDVS